MDRIQTEIYRISSDLGVELSTRNPEKTYMWDTKTIGIGGLNYSNQLHELAHWQIAGPKMRQEIDFGLGAGPESGKSVKRKMPLAECQMLEEEASLLGIAYEAYLGLPFDKTLKSHEWLSQSDDSLFWVTINRLTNKGLLENHLPKVR